MAATSDDPTLEFLERLKDDSNWDIRKDVPIFCPHERRGKDGKPIKVNVERLQRIVENAKRLKQRRAVVPRIMIGHTKPEADEEDQPDIVGFADNWRLGKFGPEQIDCILVDRYFKKSCRDKLYHPDGDEIYPYRSVEFYPDSDEITAVSLLKRDPQLDMGVTYERHSEGGSYFYVMGDDMPPPMPEKKDPTQPPVAAAPGKPPMPVRQEEEDPEYKKFGEHFERHMNHHPMLKYMASCYERDMGKHDGSSEGAEDGAAPSGAEPSPKKHSSESAERDPGAEETFRRQSQPMREQLREMKEELDKMRNQEKSRTEKYNRSEAKRLIGKLQGLGFLIENPEKEENRMAAMNDEQRGERYDEIYENYQRAPVGGGYVEVANLDGSRSEVSDSENYSRQDPEELTEKDMVHAEAYMRRNPGRNHEEVWEKAREYALEQRNKRRR